MKYSKILLGVMAILFAFTSCENKDDVVSAKPITAPSIQNPDGSASYVLDPADANGSFDTFLWTEAYLGEGLTPTYELQFDLGTGDFSDPKKISDIEGFYYGMKVSDMNQMLREMGTTAGVLSNIQFRVVAKAGDMVQASTAVSFLVNRYIYQDEIITIGLFGTSVGDQEFMPMVNEAGTNNWSITSLLKEGDFVFKDNSYRQTTFGKDADNDGNLIENGGEKFITMNKVYTITYNGDDLTYTMEESSFPNQLYVVGDWNGWNNSNSGTIPDELSNNFDGTYDVFMNWTAAGGFKIIETIGSWDPQYADLATDPGNNKLSKGGENISIPDAGMFFIQADLAAMSWTVTPTVWGIIGSSTPLGWDGQTNFDVANYDATTKTYTMEIDLTAGELKFRGTEDWNINFGSVKGNGGDLVGEATIGGDNISITEAGTYVIMLQLASNNYNYSIVKK
ncbi:SusE domain-containing protein [Prolixibacteraceae bacterium]|nr:SusE domain-containing protein [Prolixibacteraceae bacterium]